MAAEADRFSIQKLQLPTPRHHGDSLLHPSRSEMARLWQSNVDHGRQTEQTQIGERNLGELRAAARIELVKLATAYSRQYGDFSVAPMNGSIVLAGHQPELFHPGVWFKNFYLSGLGTQFKCPAINLIVDNDICTRPMIKVPSWASVEQLPRTSFIPFDGPAYNIPFEERGIEDQAVFQSFEDRTANSITRFVDDPLVHRLWPHVRVASREIIVAGNQRLGHSIAAGRHRLESELGLQSLEIPLSQVAGTESFAQFVWHIISRLDRFREIYNSSLNVYREVHGLRSRSHPVPELECRDHWIEIPFWIWSHSSPLRKRAFVCPRDTTFLIGDLDGWQMEIKHNRAVDDLSELPQQGIRLRPRALMTTMYSRLILSDLFIHGIGGGKYDQLTDLIATRFWGFSLPEFCVCSATFKLPTNTTDDSLSDITAAKQTLREMEHQPERFIDVDEFPAAQSIVERKYEWIDRTDGRHRYRLDQRHAEIMRANSDLQPYLKKQRAELQKRLRELKNQIRVNEILGSREFSFCLFPASLADEMLAM